jgi:carbonic anhydrase
MSKPLRPTGIFSRIRYRFGITLSDVKLKRGVYVQSPATTKLSGSALSWLESNGLCRQQGLVQAAGLGWSAPARDGYCLLRQSRECDLDLRADQGEFFIHRNIANLVPPYQPDGDHHGTSAAVEYAVRVLKVSNLIILGHSGCGGIKGCIDMCKGNAPELEAKDSFVGRWMGILRPRFERVADIEDEEAQAQAMEKQAIVTSLENLMTFPWIGTSVDAGELTLHGLWNDIGEGSLEHYNPQTDSFHQV